MQKIEQRAMSNEAPSSRGSVTVPELDNRGWNITLFNVLNETAPIKGHLILYVVSKGS